MVNIIGDLTSKNEEGSEVVVKAAKDIQRGIEDLLRYAQVPTINGQ